MNAYAIRLRPGDDPKAALDALAETEAWEAASVLTCVGSLRKAVLRFANQEAAVTLDRSLRNRLAHWGLLKIWGPYHIAISDGQGRTYDGHLMDGSEIYTTAEKADSCWPSWTMCVSCARSTQRPAMRNSQSNLLHRKETRSCHSRNDSRQIFPR